MRMSVVCLCWLFLFDLVQAADYALIVGVNECPRFVLPNGSKPRPLRGAEADADAIAAMLAGTFRFERDNIVMLKGDKATLAGVRAAFQKLQKQLKLGDRFVFHFSGHGTQIDDRKPFDEEDDLDEALCLFDAESNGKNLLLDDELGRWLDDLSASAVTILLDCCHAGTGHKELDDDVQSRSLPGRVSSVSRSLKEGPWRDVRGQQKSFGRQTAAFFACRAEQQAYERRWPGLNDQDSVRAGQFTHWLRRGLESGKADLDGDKRITQEEVRRYVEQQLNETFNSRRPIPVDQQHPVLESPRPEAAMFFLTDR